MQMLGSVGSKGARLPMPEVVAIRHLYFFFPFLDTMRIATGRHVGLINAINGSNDATWWHSHSLSDAHNNK